MSDELRVVVVIVDYNTADETVKCLRALEGSAPSGLAVVPVVVDNSDRVPFPGHEDVEVLRPGENVGLAAAWKLGFERARDLGADYCLFLNNDAIVAPDFFTQMELGVRKYGPRAALGPRILYADRPDVVWSRGGSVNARRVMVEHHGGEQLDAALPVEDFETGHLSGCCLLVPMPLLEEIGGPDDGFFFRGEEWDLNHRLVLAGARLLLCDRARVFHAVNRSHDRFAPRMLYFAYRAKVRFARKHQSAVWFALWCPLAAAYAVLVAPAKFDRISTGPSVPGRRGVLRRVLARAFRDGLRLDRIRAEDFPRALEGR